MKSKYNYFQCFIFFISLFTFCYFTGDEITYTNWDSKRPDEYSDQCLVVASNGRWRDEECSGRKNYICETGQCENL